MRASDIWRGLLPALLLLSAPPGGAADVRVRLYETDAPTRVAGRVVGPGPSGLIIDGRPHGPRWRSPGPGPQRADGTLVRGALEVARTPAGLQVVNHVALEDYVVAAVGSEIFPHWEPEVLKAQAVVARTYVVHQQGQHPGRGFDVEAGTNDQVYRGVAGESEGVRAAARETAGELLLFEGAPILAAFHAASGGRTASAEEVWGRFVPYLVSQDVPREEDSPHDYWRARITGTTLERALVPLGLRLGAVREVRIAERSSSGRAVQVWVGGPDGGGSLSGRALRSALGASVIRSTLFEVRGEGSDFIFAGSGHGHGVGMSQWGARAMARDGATYREILAAFYPGTRLGSRPVRRSSR